MRARILVVDDDAIICTMLKLYLEKHGYQVDCAGDCSTALDMVRSTPYQLVITDLRLPGLSGMEFLATIRAEKHPLGVLMQTGFGDTEIAIDAMKAGADDFITKPCEPECLCLVVDRILHRRSLVDELESLRHQMREHYRFQTMVSKSPWMRKVFDLIQNVAPLGSTVLINGETGTGKELVARAIHSADNRLSATAPFVALNCASLNDSLLETELFGHERGAFTGAETRRKGRFEMAHNGTLFLDEIGDISAAMQIRLLRVLDSGTFQRVGSSETIHVNVRFLAASNKRLEDEVKAGRFRSDLFYRLNVLRISLPPLRDRPEDIPLLATHFLERFSTKSLPMVNELDHEAMQALISHQWPGNVRELENAIKAAVAMTDGSIIHRHHLPAAIAPREAKPDESVPLIKIDKRLPELTEELIAQVERDYLTQLLGKYKGNVARCAQHSGLSRRSVTQKLQKYGLDRTKFKESSSRPTKANSSAS